MILLINLKKNYSDRLDLFMSLISIYFGTNKNELIQLLNIEDTDLEANYEEIEISDKRDFIFIDENDIQTTQKIKFAKIIQKEMDSKKKFKDKNYVKKFKNDPQIMTNYFRETYEPTFFEKIFKNLIKNNNINYIDDEYPENHIKPFDLFSNNDEYLLIENEGKNSINKYYFNCLEISKDESDIWAILAKNYRKNIVDVSKSYQSEIEKIKKEKYNSFINNFNYKKYNEKNII